MPKIHYIKKPPSSKLGGCYLSITGKFIPVKAFSLLQ